MQWPLDLGATFCNFGSELDAGLPVGTTATHEVEVIVRVPPSSKVVVQISATGKLVETRPVVIVLRKLVDVEITSDVGAGNTEDVVGTVVTELSEGRGAVGVSFWLGVVAVVLVSEGAWTIVEVVLVDGGCGCCAVAGEVGVVTGTGDKEGVEDGAVTTGGGDDEMEGTTTAELVVDAEVVPFLKDPSCLLFKAVRVIFVGTS